VGAGGWWYRCEYQASVAAALRDVQEVVFSSGDNYKVWEGYPNHLQGWPADLPMMVETMPEEFPPDVYDQATIDAMVAGGGPATIEQARPWSMDTGTASILDITEVGESPTSGNVSPLNATEAEHLFGASKPISACEDRFLAYFATPATNGRTEGTHRIIKHIKRLSASVHPHPQLQAPHPLPLPATTLQPTSGGKRSRVKLAEPPERRRRAPADVRCRWSESTATPPTRPVAMALCHGRRFEFDHELRESQPSYANQAPRWHDTGGAGALTQHGGVLEEGFHVRGVHAEPHDVRQGHAGARQHGFEVVERQPHLGRHVPGVLGCAVPIDRQLPSAHEYLRLPLDDFTLVESKLERPFPRVHSGSLHEPSPLRRLAWTGVRRPSAIGIRP
jgi:hypothetical protein